MNRYLFIAFALIVVWACAKETSDESALLWTGDSFVASTQKNIGAKASLTAGVNAWSDGDEVAVFADGGPAVRFIAGGSGESVQFATSEQVTGSSFVLIYPYAAADGVSGGLVNAVIPQRQTAVSGSYDPSAALSVASTSNLSSRIQFRNAHALLQLSVPAELAGRAVSITLKAKGGETLSGKVSVNPQTIECSDRTVVYDNVGLYGNPVLEKATYYIAVAPAQLSEGLRVSVNMSDRSCYVRETPPLTIEANVIYNLGVTATRGWNYGVPKYEVTTVLGSTTGTNIGVPGDVSAARLANPQDIVSGSDGNYWITTRLPSQFSVWKMTPDYSLSMFVTDLGPGTYPWSGAEYSGRFYVALKGTAQVASCGADGTFRYETFTAADGSVVAYKNAMDVDFDAEGNMYVLYRHKDSGENYFVKVAGGKVVKLWEMPYNIYDTFVFNEDRTTAFVFGNDGIRTIDVTSASSEPVKIAGAGTHTASSDYTDGTPGQPLTASFNTSEGAVLSPDGTIYFTDLKAFTVRSFSPDADGDYSKGTISTLCGAYFSSGVDDGTDNQARLKYPGGIALCDDGLLFIDGTSNGTVRKVTFAYDEQPCADMVDREDFAGVDDVQTIF